MKTSDKKVYEETLNLFNGCCAICGSPYPQLHHVYEGKNRKNSTKYSMLVPLCKTHHDWVHKTNYQGFKKKYQAKFEETHTREEFIKIFGRNYL